MTPNERAVSDPDVRVTPLVHRGEEVLVVSYPLRRPGSFALLSAAELAVVEAILEGRSHRDVASERGVSVRTVANQLASAYRKLKVRGAAELAVLVQSATATPSGRTPPSP